MAFDTTTDEGLAIVHETVDAITAVIEDYLREAGASLSEIEAFKTSPGLVSKIFQVAEATVIAVDGDLSKMADYVPALAIGVLASIGAATFGIPALGGITVSTVLDYILTASIEALDDLQSDDNTDEVQNLFDIINFSDIKRFDTLLTEIALTEGADVLTYKLNNGTSFTAPSLLHQQIIDNLASYSEGENLFDVFIERENLIRQYSGEQGEGIEGFIISLEKLFFGNSSDAIGTAEEYSSRASAILSYLEINADAGWSLVDTASLAGSAHLNNADGFAYRYALENLNPVAITGNVNLYSQHNENDELNIDNFSEQYLKDRADFLANLILINTGTQVENVTSHVRTYEDMLLGKIATLSGTSNINDRYTFGTNDDDVIEGGNGGDDHLYGRDGDDSINGGAGDDYIEGNSGNDTIIGGEGEDHILGGDGQDVIYGGDSTDTIIGGNGDDSLYGNASGVKADLLDGGDGTDNYYIFSQDGNTIIKDSDLTGFIHFNDEIIGTAAKNIKVLVPGSNVYEDDDGHRYAYSAGLLNITLSTGQEIIIEGFVMGQGNQLGLVFNDDVIPLEEPHTSISFNGDFAWQDFDPDQEGIQVEYDEFGNVIQNLNTPQDTADTLYGSASNDFLSSGNKDDFVNGKAGDDLIDGGDGKDKLFGGDGNDLIQGGSDSDTLYGQDGDDTLYADQQQSFELALSAEEATNQRGSLLSGGKGDDYLLGNAGDDVLLGGSGSDVIIGSAGNDNIRGDTDITGTASLDWSSVRSTDYDVNSVSYGFYENFNTTINTDGDDDYLYGGSGDDWLWGQTGNDLLDGGTGNDILLGGDGSDILLGGAGNDTLSGDNLNSTNPGNDILLGGEGNDTLYGVYGDDTLSGGLGEDHLQGGEGNDLLDGGEDNDVLYGEEGQDRLAGGDGNDDLYGGADDDILLGDAGNDYLDGEDGADELYGGAGEDTLFGSAGNDILDGGEGNDNLEGDEDDDTLRGGSGDDTLFGGTGNDNLEGGTDDDHLEGGEGHDYLNGGSGDDTLYGQDGNDILDGGEGNDALLGGAGDDELSGGAGNDNLWGGEGSDVFIFGLGDGQDIILDGQSNDTVRFKAGLTIDSITTSLVEDQSGQVFLAINHGQADSLYIKNGQDGIISNFEFSNGAVYGFSDFFDRTYQAPTGDDTSVIYGTTDVDPEIDPDSYGDNQNASETVNISKVGDSTLVTFTGNTLVQDSTGVWRLTLGHSSDTLTFRGGIRNTDDHAVRSFLGTLDQDRVRTEPYYLHARANDYFNGSGYYVTKRFISPTGATHTFIVFSSNDDGSLEPIIQPYGSGYNNLDPSAAFNVAERTVSPLVLDLGGDGIQTLSQDAGVYFDHDNNGLAEKTGWIGANEGLLVLDRNQDGIVNNGSELFGNNTKLFDGTFALNAYQALAEYDENSDGVISNLDSIFSELRVWQDLNSDGISQLNELLSLDSVGIESLNTDYQSTTINDGNGNTIKQTSLASMVDDTTIQTADIWFGVNKTQTVNLNPTIITEDIAALPEASAFGNVKSLHQTMMDDSDLVNLVTQFAQATTNADRLALIDDIIYQWTGSSDVDPYSRDPSKVYGHVMDARQLVTLENLMGRSYLGTWCWGERDPNPHGQAAPKLVAEYQKFKTYVTAQLMSQTVYQDIFSKMSATYNFETEQFEPELSDFISGLKELISTNEEYVIGAINTLKGMTVYSSVLQAEFALLKSDDVLSSYALDTVISGTEFADTLVGGATDDYIRGNQGDDALFGGSGNDQYYFDLGDGSDRIFDISGQDRLNFGPDISLDNIVVTRNLTALFISILDIEGSPTGDQIQIDNVYDFDGTVTASAIENIHFFDGTTLTLSEFMAATLIQVVTEGDDVLYGTEADETFNALAGNDTIYGGAGNDTYQFAIGDGQDIIVENSGNDTIEFTNGLVPQQVKIERTGFQGEDLVLHLFDENGDATGDSIRIIKAYQSYNASSSRVENVQFTLSDGTVQVLSIDDLEKLYNVTELDDVIYGFESDDVISALSGIDTVHGAGGNDTLYGDNDDDVLFGENGDDTLIGGKGNDILDGGAGNDTYFFASGDGHDIINNTDSSSIDVLEFDSSISQNKVRLLRVDNDLFISIDRNTESVQVKNYFNGDVISNTALKEIRFADGTVLSVADVINLTLEATQQADYIEAFAGDDTIAARGGDDIVYAKTGDDMVSGDQGNDLIFGENGNDLLLGQQGQDQLYGGQGDDLLFGGNEEDQLYGNSGQDVLYGENDSDLLYGGSQDDMLYGGNGSDQLYGELGNDTLNGDDGNDLLVGGAGDDTLSGGLGDDTYQYAVGDGNDLIQTGKKETSGYDVLSLSGVNTDQIWLTEQGDDLVVSFVGEDDQITIEDWQYKIDAVDEIQVGGFSAYQEDIERLVSAMASFDVQSGAGEILPQEVKDQLQPVLANSWHA
jgi:Ca2+-binding RTX toxin-like protein